MNLSRIQAFLKGKKTYITAFLGLAGAAMAWADGQISGTALLASVWAAAQTAFIRAGVDNAVAKAVQ